MNNKNFVADKLDQEVKNLETISFMIESGQATEPKEIFVLLNESIKKIDSILKDQNHE